MRRVSRVVVVSMWACAACSCPAHPDAGGADSGPPVMPVNGCTAEDFAANDRRSEAASRVITFSSTATPGPYAPRCMIISGGQSVTWNGSFANHPLEQFGGDESVWIAPTNSGSTAMFAFPVTGVYGFRSARSPSTMQGAIWVR